jgi:hypothetical protein
MLKLDPATRSRPNHFHRLRTRPTLDRSPIEIVTCLTLKQIRVYTGST